MKAKSSPLPLLFLLILTSCMLVSSCQKDHNIQHYIIDESASAMEWKGYLKDGSGNNGTIKITGQLLVAEPYEIIGGQISLPLSSLVNINLPTDELKQQLIHHLQSQDFFDMAAYPEIGYKITSLIPDKNIAHTYQASGDLTLLGKTKPVNFPVQIKLQENQLIVTGETSIDRTIWGMDYASDENAANGMYIRPGIDVQFKLVALKK
ncbi:YceI family protein [Larkinella sp. C7]|jgi:polyisoprenoid-binding protein YceI|uniref:YceI family protein n=1 Tax=Larkinella sp. C7 TaxID=2576607 RepID=UPI00111137FE|nr:YceI family protein [Larkinella sp. C7]